MCVDLSSKWLLNSLEVNWLTWKRVQGRQVTRLDTCVLHHESIRMIDVDMKEIVDESNLLGQTLLWSKETHCCL